MLTFGFYLYSSRVKNCDPKHRQSSPETQVLFLIIADYDYLAADAMQAW